MLQHIASFLPTSSAAALALCSRSLNRVLGTQYWEKLRETHQEGREEFLWLLEKDLPDYIFCQRCAKLHRPDSRGAVEVDLSLGQQRPCFEADMSAHTIWYYRDRLRFEHVQIAMKQHRLGLNSSIHVDHQSHTETYESGSPYGHQVSFNARIVSNTFLVRAQDRLLIPADEVVPSLPIEFLAICPHLPDMWLYHDELSEALRCRLSHLHDQHPCAKCDGLKQCRYCPTEYQIDQKSFGKRGNVIFITRWLDLGAGSTHLDPKWRSHVWEAASVGTDKAFEFAAGSIRAVFELQEHFSFESIVTSDNLRKLLPK